LVSDKSKAAVSVRHHETLKQPCVTRWNSVLAMIDSVLCLWNEMAAALTRNGDREYCLSENDKDVLLELRHLLKPFHNLTKLVSCQQPTLSLVPLIIKEVRETVKRKPDNSDSDVVGELKDALAARVDHRIQITETVQMAALLDPAMKDFVVVEKGEEWVKSALKEKTLKAVQRMNSVKNASAAANHTVGVGQRPESQPNDAQSTSDVSSPKVMN